LEKQITGENDSISSQTGKKNMVVLYDDGDNSDEILKITNYFMNTENFKLNVVALNRKDHGSSIKLDSERNFTNAKDKQISSTPSSLRYLKRREHFLNAGVNFNEIFISQDIEKDEKLFGKTILKSIIECNPDIVITESTIGNYSLLSKSNFSNLLMYRLNCPIIVVRDFSIPFVNILIRILLKIKGNMGPSYLLKLISNKK
jgi:hypothetical protein